MGWDPPPSLTSLYSLSLLNCVEPHFLICKVGTRTPMPPGVCEGFRGSISQPACEGMEQILCPPSHSPQMERGHAICTLCNLVAVLGTEWNLLLFQSFKLCRWTVYENKLFYDKNTWIWSQSIWVQVMRSICDPEKLITCLRFGCVIYR